MKRMCKDCGKKYAQEMGLCRTCQSLRIAPNTPETRRCPQCRLSPPHVRCSLTLNHPEQHHFADEFVSTHD